MSTELKCIKKTIFEVNYNDLDRFLSEVFNVQFEIVAHHELMNDVAWTTTVEAEPLDEYYQQKLEKGDLMWMGHQLLCEACHRGLIEAGDYVVEISW